MAETDGIEGWEDVLEEDSSPSDASTPTLDKVVAREPPPEVPCLNDEEMITFVCWMLGKPYLSSEGEYVSALGVYGNSKPRIQENVFRHIKKCPACSNAHEDLRELYHDMRQSQLPRGGK